MAKYMAADSIDHLAAQAVLLVLRATLPEMDELEGVFVLPERREFSLEQAAEVLAKMPKPLECAARAEDGKLAVTCKSLSPELRWVYEAQQRQLNTGRETVGGVRMQEIDDAKAPRILLLGPSESLLLSLEAVKSWRRDYLITPPHGISGDFPKSEERQRGASWVLRVGRESAELIGPADIESVPEPFREVIKEEYERTLQQGDSTSPD